MTDQPKELSPAAFDTQDSTAPPRGYEYQLSQPLELELGAFGDSTAVPLELLDAREMKALKQWQHSLLALRHAISGHR